MLYIAISSAHNAPPFQTEGENRRARWGRLEWDAYQFENYWEAAGMVLDDLKTDQAFEHIFNQTTGHRNVIFVGDKETARQGYLWVIAIKDQEDARRFLTGWVESIKADVQESDYGIVGWASGDDAHYDYAPDEAEIIHQIAEHFNLLEEVYRPFYDWAKATWYNDGGEDDDLLIAPPSS